MIEMPILDLADQQFGVILNDQRVTIRVRYNPTTGRWTMDLSIDDLPVIHGRRIVLGVDLLEPFNLGIGKIFALPTSLEDVPGRTELPQGIVRLYHATDAEYQAALEEIAA